MTTIRSTSFTDETTAGLHWPNLPYAKIAAALIWILGSYLTYLSMARMVTSLYVALGLAILAQVILTKLEAPIWSRWMVDDQGEWVKRAMHPSSPLALMVDALFNLPGAWLVVHVLHTWLPITTIGEITGWHMQPLVGWPGLGVTCVLAIVPCALPEVLWRWE